MRPSIAIFLLCVATAMRAPAEDDLSPEELEAGQIRRKQELAAIDEEIESFDEQRQLLVRRRSMDRAREIAGQIKSLKEKSRQLKKLSAADYALAIRAEQAERKAKMQEAKREEALRKSLPSMRELANCGPLAIHDCQMIKSSTYALMKELGSLEGTRLGVHLRDDYPQLVVTVIVTGNVSVESYEVSFNVVDSFGQPVANSQRSDGVFVAQKTLRTPLSYAETDTATNWGSKDYRNAFSATAWVSRVRLADGTLWEQSREDALKKPHAWRDSERVDLWMSRECRD